MASVVVNVNVPHEVWCDTERVALTCCTIARADEHVMDQSVREIRLGSIRGGVDQGPLGDAHHWFIWGTEDGGYAKHDQVQHHAD